MSEAKEKEHGVYWVSLSWNWFTIHCIWWNTDCR